MWRRFAQRKALAKTVSWRGLSFVVTTSGVWMITGQLTLAASVGVLEVVVKSIGYYLHECAWEWVDHCKVSERPFFAWIQVRVGWLTQEHRAIQPEETIG
jgi:uncharacterized membrane protein